MNPNLFIITKKIYFKVTDTSLIKTLITYDLILYIMPTKVICCKWILSQFYINEGIFYKYMSDFIFIVVINNIKI